ncbi:MAG: hypothetical protein MK365_09140 [Vicinamibacterales bacterium]|jgi:mono/diheme cytochrome c family protein|nr:hypothetical protein [Vicinamibacterales bacterium]HIN12456.1 hypothetical protein [Acidobacteriota bacterium]
MKRAVTTVVVVFFVGALSLVTAGASAAAPAADTPTFTKDVAPILYEHCVVCHRPGEVAPMTLIRYEDVRPWSRAIKAKVESREMPPWHADPRFGEFRNARGLTGEQVATIVAWSDGGAPRGTAADLPVVPAFPDGWAGGEPTYIIEMPVEFELPTQGEIDYHNFYTPVPFPEDVFLKGIEMRPGNRAAVHHAGAYNVELPAHTHLKDGLLYWDADDQLVELGTVRQTSRETLAGVTPGSEKLISYVPGRGYEEYGRGAAKRLSAGKMIHFHMHYQPTGRPERDRTLLGLYEYEGRPTHEVVNSLSAVGPSTYIAAGSELQSLTLPVIPPMVEDWELIGITAVPNAITIHGLSPHLHLRGKSMTYVVTYPDGRSETLLSVPNYDFNWQHYYDFAEPKRVPAGSTIMVRTLFDNSLKNRYNPAPDKEVYWGEQSWDEMYAPQIRVTLDRYDLSKPPGKTQ